MSREFAVLLGCLLVAMPSAAEIGRWQRDQLGTQVEILVWNPGPSTAAAVERAYAEIDRIERLMSGWTDTSEVSRLNREAATRPVSVSRDTMIVLESARRVSRASDGAFDISWAGMRGLWDFGAAGLVVPSQSQIDTARSRVDYRRIRLNTSELTVRFLDPGLAIGLGGIAKGYAVDRAVAVLLEQGLSNFLVSAGGDMAIRGSKSGTPWSVGLRHPRGTASDLMATVVGRDEAVVTSGDYERFAMVGKRRYHHILDPRTGRPATGAISVSVIARSAMMADAYSTAAFVLGARDGLALLERTPGVEGVVVDGAGRIHLTTGARGRVKLLIERVVDP